MFAFYGTEYSGSRTGSWNAQCRMLNYNIIVNDQPFVRVLGRTIARWRSLVRTQSIKCTAVGLITFITTHKMIASCIIGAATLYIRVYLIHP